MSPTSSGRSEERRVGKECGSPWRREHERETVKTARVGAAVVETVKARKLLLFQAEDGIRGIGVTGVQTCALPICRSPGGRRRSSARSSASGCSAYRATGFEADAQGGRARSRRLECRRRRAEDRKSVV